MSRYLFSMSDAELDAAVEAHYDRMYDDYYHTNEPEPCCDNCRYYSPGVCTRMEDKLTDEDFENETDEWKACEKDPEDYCDDWEIDESKYEDPHEDDRDGDW